jgi:hypothetical protein
MLVPVTGSWTFAHRVVHDYLAARYWVETFSPSRHDGLGGSPSHRTYRENRRPGPKLIDPGEKSGNRGKDRVDMQRDRVDMEKDHGTPWGQPSHRTYPR